ncbi:uncharacterized protein LOC123427997 [Hordeum vulgare subsp. vulgare]|uniref:Uncharacterized protein n=1 Tax=Hordeum vulgare subsp. vulgare TaxID=112509 RepID=A0A287JE96_HORVV|nr:uncharacterized protein LOC123427997 [Hordeum vulgare subsp. vulgare]KAI5010609.1 hypothetical protein ZWY2020_012746 [Hordeum vulgare]
MEARREIAKRARTAATSNDDDDTGSQGSAGGAAAASSGVAVSTGVAEMDGEELAVVAAAEPQVVGSAETEEHVQRILLAIDNFTRKVSEMLDSGRAMFKDLAADFEDRLCTIHKERVEKWEEEIRELRARDAANERTRAVLHNAQLQLFHIRE